MITCSVKITLLLIASAIIHTFKTYNKDGFNKKRQIFFSATAGLAVVPRIFSFNCVHIVTLKASTGGKQKTLLLGWLWGFL